jgi:hypothetical protein
LITSSTYQLCQSNYIPFLVLLPCTEFDRITHQDLTFQFCLKTLPAGDSLMANASRGKKDLDAVEPSKSTETDDEWPQVLGPPFRVMSSLESDFSPKHPETTPNTVVN